ncbi:DUF397 domain-containing protein [Streptomyces sp. NBC_01497]|uniref:DUF397 domain-containing protein n=1 Tax=Streptomyces sp. NBC_01497 TaxID=2903885 RepID=UPI002E380EB6|nr:DUF397 domain-containing protein [Streptomyces sp. NBC_01497]
MSPTANLSWIKSSHSGGEGDNCVEVALEAEAVHVRDSKDTGRRPFTVTPDAWSAFTTYASAS